MSWTNSRAAYRLERNVARLITFYFIYGTGAINAGSMITLVINLPNVYVPIAREFACVELGTYYAAVRYLIEGGVGSVYRLLCYVLIPDRIAARLPIPIFILS